MQFKGVIPPMITPFRVDGSIDYDAFAGNMEKWNLLGLAGYLVLGSNSETAYMSDQEKLKLIRITKQVAAPGLSIMAGTGLESITETLRFTSLAAGEGAQSALVLTPNYYKSQMNDTALIGFFEELANESPIPILIYNVPNYTGINVSVNLVKVLSRHPNIIGMKDSSGNIGQLILFQQVADVNFQILTGTASIWHPALTLGVKAAVMALANCAPAECVQVQQLYEQGHTDAALELYRCLVPVNHAVTATYGIAGLKYATQLKGFAGGTTRKPLLELSENAKQDILSILQVAALLD